MSLQTHTHNGKDILGCKLLCGCHRYLKNTPEVVLLVHERGKINKKVCKCGVEVDLNCFSEGKRHEELMNTDGWDSLTSSSHVASQSHEVSPFTKMKT